MKKIMILSAVLIFISGSAAIAKVQNNPPGKNKSVVWFGKCSQQNGKQKRFHKKFTKKAQYQVQWQRNNS